MCAYVIAQMCWHVTGHTTDVASCGRCAAGMSKCPTFRKGCDTTLTVPSITVTKNRAYAPTLPQKSSSPPAARSAIAESAHIRMTQWSGIL